MKYFMEPRNPWSVWCVWADNHPAWAIFQIVVTSVALVTGIPTLIVYILG